MIKNKKLYFLIFILVIFSSIFSIKFSFSDDEDTCEYEDKIEQCVKAVNAGKPRSIKEFICINGSREEITYQIILDEKFNEIDEDIEDYLQTLEDEKDRFFGPNSSENYLQAADEVEKKFAYYGEYWEDFNDVCGVEIIEDVQSCQDGKTTILGASPFFKVSDCMLLANTKLNIYREVAYDILQLNKAQVRKDYAKLYQQDERTKYDDLLDAMMINIGYVERIWQKWPKKLRNTYGN